VADDPNVGIFKYWAFISYSHCDQNFARRLQHRIEGYRVPREMEGRKGGHGVFLPRRPAPVFRDRDELGAAPDLTDAIKEALGGSLNLVVVCTPNSVNSEWVQREIGYFRALGREARIHYIIGIPDRPPSGMDGRDAGELIPGLRGRLGGVDASTVPLAPDARRGRDGFRDASLKIVAAVLGVAHGELEPREKRRRRRRRVLIAAAVATCICLGAVAYVADADAGAPLPGAARIRRFLDQRRMSVFRPIYSAARIRDAIDAQCGTMLRAQEPFFMAAPGFAGGSDSRDPQSGVWAGLQLASAILQSGLSDPAAAATAMRSIDVAFAMPAPDRSEGWPASKNERYASLEPTAWTCIALVAALRHPAAQPDGRRGQLLDRLGETQRMLDGFRCGGDRFGSFVPASPGVAGNAYATVLVLGAMLDCREAGLGWSPAAPSLDERIRAVCRSLCEGMVQARPLPGWPLSFGTKWGPRDGLTLQVLAELLRADRLGVFDPPGNVVSALPAWLGYASSVTDIEDKDDFTQPLRTPDGGVGTGSRTVGFLHRPWSVCFAGEFIDFAARRRVFQDGLPLAERTLSFQVVDEGPDTLSNGARLPFYYSAEYVIAAERARRLPWLAGK
jgi:MTH538 TIR-like domain (DUF1863)